MTQAEVIHKVHTLLEELAAVAERHGFHSFTCAPEIFSTMNNSAKARAIIDLVFVNEGEPLPPELMKAEANTTPY